MLSSDFSSLEDARGIGFVLSLLPWSMESDAQRFLFLCGLVFLSVLLRLVFVYASGVAFSRHVTDLMHDLRVGVMRRYLSFGKGFFDRNNAGYLHSVLLDYTSHVVNAMGTIHHILAASFQIIFYAGLLFWLHWQLTLFVAVLFPILHVSLRSVVARIRRGAQRQAVELKAIGEHAHDLLANAPLVRAYSQEESEVERFALTSRRIMEIEFQQQKRKHLLEPAQEGMLMVVVLLLALFVGRTTTFETETVSRLLVFFYVLKRSSTRVGDLNRVRGPLAQVSGRLGEVLKVFRLGDAPCVPSGTRPFTGLRQGVSFVGLSFGYDEDRRILHGVTFTVKASQVTAIVGQTGAGKTTLVSLLARQYDVPPGTVLLDGVSIRELSTESLLAHMAIVTQEPLILNDTIRANLLYGLEDHVDEARLLEVVRQARLDGFVDSLPTGLDTPVGDRGVTLSGGERQRLSIARAMLKDADILILDEATSSLDSRTEALVQTAIEECVRGRTAIVIAHRLSTIRRADRVVVLEDGRVVEEGTLSELLSRPGAFATYWRSQFHDDGGEALGGGEGREAGRLAEPSSVEAEEQRGEA